MGHSLNREKAPQTQRLARLETVDFVEYLVAGAGNRRYLHLNYVVI